MDIKTLVKMELMEGLMDYHALSGIPIADMINEAVKDYLEKKEEEEVDDWISKEHQLRYEGRDGPVDK
jgi:hypothetical protein